MNNYDVIIIGAGPGGYVAAIRCAQLGLKTACVERWKTPQGESRLGGTCLNVGCIPSKALLDSTHHYEFMHKNAALHGISCTDLTVDVGQMQSRKAGIVDMLTQGIAALFKKNKIEDIRGHARLLGNEQVEVIPAEGDSFTITAPAIILATGSVPVALPITPVDDEYIVDSSGALAFDAAPARLGVIGAGVIGLELGSVWSRLGSKVTLLEAMPNFLSSADKDIAKAAQRAMKKQGLDIRMNAKVTAASVADGQVTVSYADKKGKTQTLDVDKLVVAVGRRANTEGLNLEAVGLATDARGLIEVDDYCATSVKGIYAVGDVVRGPMLAHKASEEGVMVAERLAGQKTEMHFDHMPWVIYTAPEIAWTGKTEAELQASGIEYRSGSFPFLASGRARAHGDTQGMVKMLADAKTDRILGIHILGTNASELLAEAVVALEFEASSEDLARTIHAHPTLSEAMHEAALAVDKRTIHA